jgi:cyclase
MEPAVFLGWVRAHPGEPSRKDGDMTYQSVILARLERGREDEVAEIFGRSDTTGLPGLAGVTSRHLYVLEDVYVHVVETESPFGPVLGRISDHPEFRRICEDLEPFVTPLFPETWRSPRDAGARCFYRWSAAGASAPAR